MSKLQPHITFDSEQGIAYIIGFTQLFTVCQSPHKLDSMAIVFVFAYAVKDAVP